MASPLPTTALLVTALLATACTALPGGRDEAAEDTESEPIVVDISQWQPGRANPAAPEALYQFGQFVGLWEAHQSALQQDGQTWVEQEQPALWRWYWILDGWAVQDDWISPAPGLDPGEAGRGWGTNIRIWNEQLGEWQMAWISNRGQEVWEFTAAWDAARGALVMQSVDLTPPRRNTFHDITGDAFNWTQEWSFDNGRSWVEVARIRATRLR